MAHLAIPTLLQSLADLLDEMRTLVGRLDDIDYAMPAPGRSSGGVGGHVRHCLDHVSALLGAARTGVCAYDRRARGTDVETNRRVALRAIAELADAVQRLDPSLMHREIEVETVFVDLTEQTWIGIAGCPHGADRPQGSAGHHRMTRNSRTTVSARPIVAVSGSAVSAPFSRLAPSISS